jgi:hypothetical protein
MKIDRSLFLLITGAIAAGAGACVIKETEPATAANPATTAAPAATTPATAAPAATAAPGAKQIGHNLKNVRGVGNLGTTPAPTPTPTPTPTPAACLDTGAATTAAGDCTTMVDKSCSWAAKRCAAYNQYLNPKVAAQAVSCSIAATNACSGQAAIGCGTTAMAASCTDPQAATACAQLAPLCGTTADACSPILSSLNAAGKQQALTYCSAEGGAGCKSAGLSACVNAALFPAAEGAAVGGGLPPHK